MNVASRSYAYHRTVDNSTLVRERDRRRRREHLRVLLFALPLAAALLGYTWLHVQVLDTGYEIGELERELAALERRRAELALEEARRAGLPEVERRARRELGMVAAGVDDTLFWSELGTASPVPSTAAVTVPEVAP